jgi:hypothetical protein
LASQFVGDHPWFVSQTGNDGDVDASALHGLEQRAEIPIAGKQHDVIDLVCDLQGVDSKFNAHAALDHRMRRNHLKGREGDRINAVLAAAGYNFSLLLRWFRRLLRALLAILARALLAPSFS